MGKRFSERIGLIQPVHTIQTESMSSELRNTIWNLMHVQFDNSHEGWSHLAYTLANYYTKTPVDEVPNNNYDCMKWFKSYFGGLQWYEVYDLVEFIVLNCDAFEQQSTCEREKLEEIYNGVFESELSGYRFIAGVLAPVSHPTEADAISSAMETAEKKGLSGARSHIQTALKLLGRKPHPDFRNSIKESISAVESVAKQISRSSANGLSGALSEFEKSVPIHGALRQGFNCLYGYTSDSDGIRHAILDEPNVGFDEAKYMLVSCSAFANYLISKADAAGMLDGT